MRFFLILFFLFTTYNTKADSPLTSIKFSTAYYDNDYIQVARQAGGILSVKLMSFLADKTISVDIKMAIINELGWRVEGKDNYRKFLNYLIQNKIIGSRWSIKKLPADIILCLAYLKAMDNYFNVKRAIRLTAQAEEKSPESYTVCLISALIKAQKAMTDDWCEVYRLTDNVRKNKTLKKDMRPEASEIIFLYMDAYKNDCK